MGRGTRVERFDSWMVWMVRRLMSLWFESRGEQRSGGLKVVGFDGRGVRKSRGLKVVGFESRGVQKSRGSKVAGFKSRGVRNARGSKLAEFRYCGALEPSRQLLEGYISSSITILHSSQQHYLEGTR